MPFPHIWWADGNPGPDNRAFFDGYLDGFVLEEKGVWTQGIDRAAKAMYCPMVTNSKFFGYGKQWPTQQTPGWRPFETSYGYYNLGWAKGLGTWQSKANMPTSVSAKGSLPLWGDLIELYSASTDIYDPTAIFRQVNHMRNGFAEFVSVSEELPLGTNVAHVDGSVGSYKYDETEVYWTFGGIQNVWVKPR